MRLQDPARVQEAQLQDTFSQLSSHVVFAAPKFHIDSILWQLRLSTLLWQLRQPPQFSVLRSSRAVNAEERWRNVTIVWMSSGSGVDSGTELLHTVRSKPGNHKPSEDVIDLWKKARIGGLSHWTFVDACAGLPFRCCEYMRISLLWPRFWPLISQCSLKLWLLVLPFRNPIPGGEPCPLPSSAFWELPAPTVRTVSTSMDLNLEADHFLMQKAMRRWLTVDLLDFRWIQYYNM